MVVDAGASSPPPNELAALDLAACIDALSPRVSYLPARGLPRAYVAVSYTHLTLPTSDLV